MFAEIAALHGAPSAPADIDKAVQIRLQRQDTLRRSGRRFHLLITETVLRYTSVPPEVMIGQLGHLIEVTTQPRLHFGIVPFGIRLPVMPEHGFNLLDDRMVLVETIAAELRLTQPREVALHRTVFDRLATVAHYGNEARHILTRVLAELTSHRSTTRKAEGI